jgi:putative membrane protein
MKLRGILALAALVAATGCPEREEVGGDVDTDVTTPPSVTQPRTDTTEPQTDTPTERELQMQREQMQREEQTQREQQTQPEQETPARDTLDQQQQQAQQGQTQFIRMTGQEFTPEQFIQNVASIGMFEVESAKLAQEKAQDEEIKQFAQELERDHQQANEELRQIAQEMEVEFPQEMMEPHRQALDKLRQASGSQFDQQFHQMQLQAHEETVRYFQTADQRIQEPELKQYVQKTLPTLREHHEQIQSHQHSGGQQSGQQQEQSGATQR